MIERTLVQKHVITPQMVARKRKRRDSRNHLSDEAVATILNAYIVAGGNLRDMEAPLSPRTMCLDAIQRWGPKLLPIELRATVLARRHGRRLTRPERPEPAHVEDHHNIVGRVMALEQRMAMLNGVRPGRVWPTGKTLRRATVRRLRFLFLGK